MISFYVIFFNVIELPWKVDCFVIISLENWSNFAGSVRGKARVIAFRMRGYWP